MDFLNVGHGEQTETDGHGREGKAEDEYTKEQVNEKQTRIKRMTHEDDAGMMRSGVGGNDRAEVIKLPQKGL